MMASETIVIGAGPAGLAFSMHHPSRILEQESEVGGLCRSFEFGGCVFDLGGHSFHTPFPEVATLVQDLMQGRWETQTRDARIAFGGQTVDYPFQQHLDQIEDASIAEECRQALPGAGDTRPYANFEDWILGRFGAGVARHFLLPYNRKLWARNLRGIGVDWVGERVAGGESSAQEDEPRRKPLSADATIGYPAEGGFAEIYRAMAARAGPVAFGERVVSIDPMRRTLTCASGSSHTWQRLVSTMPLPALLACLPDCPETLANAASRLEAVSLKIVMIAAEKAPGVRPQRLYIADPAVPAHKIAFNHLSSTALRQRPREAVMCEISYSTSKPAPDDDTLERTMIEWLVSRGLIDAGPNLEARTIDLPLAYPVPTPERDTIVKQARNHLEQFDIHSIGRFGGWSYANSDACVREAMMLAQRLSSH